MIVLLVTPFHNRVIWVLIVTIAFGLFTYMVTNDIIKLMSFPVSVDVSDEYQIPLDFPAVTICNENSLRYVHN